MSFAPAMADRVFLIPMGRWAARRQQGQTRRRAHKDVGVKTLHYLYDFGDGWQHTIRIERLIDSEPGVNCAEATGRCPPEDVGGPWSYAELRAATMTIPSTSVTST